MKGLFQCPLPLVGDRNLRKRGCNRPPVLGTAALYGWRGIKALRQVVRDDTLLYHKDGMNGCDCGICLLTYGYSFYSRSRYFYQPR